ncbi:MAG TPA: hypothetical protein VHA12_04035 [Candidatus Nanoarchaeia archaeon]|nr:hypothetical protein [Candidatus Nanoarchaeia archaeon]
MILLVINVLVLLAVILFFVKGAVINYRKHREFSYLEIFLAFLAFVCAFLNTFWIFGVYSYSTSDLLTLINLSAVLQAVIFYFFARIFKKNTLSNITLFLYISSLILIFISPLNFRPFSIILSFFFMLLMFTNLLDSVNQNVKRIGYVGILYAGISVILFFLYMFGIDNLSLFNLISNFVLLLVAMLSSMEIIELPKSLKLARDDYSVFLVFVRYFIFILAFTNLVLIGTLGLHEFSHVLVARYYDCDARAIFFEKGIYPYSEINCTNLAGKNMIALAGPVLPILLAMILFFVENSITRAVALLAIGFNLVSGYQDFKGVGISDSIILVFTLFGIFLLVLGVVDLAKFIFKRQINTPQH